MSTRWRVRDKVESAKNGPTELISDQTRLPDDGC